MFLNETQFVSLKGKKFVVPLTNERSQINFCDEKWLNTCLNKYIVIGWPYNKCGMLNNPLDFNNKINPSFSSAYSHRENYDFLIWVENVLKKGRHF